MPNEVVSQQTEVRDEYREVGRQRMAYDLTKHYVRVQVPDATWDGTQYDDLRDEIDPKTGDFAYTEVVNGSRDDDSRRMAGKRNLAILACSKEYADYKMKKASDLSRDALAAQNAAYEDEFQGAVVTTSTKASPRGPVQVIVPKVGATPA